MLGNEECTNINTVLMIAASHQTFPDNFGVCLVKVNSV